MENTSTENTSTENTSTENTYIDKETCRCLACVIRRAAPGFSDSSNPEEDAAEVERNREERRKRWSVMTDKANQVLAWMTTDGAIVGKKVLNTNGGMHNALVEKIREGINGIPKPDAEIERIGYQFIELGFEALERERFNLIGVIFENFKGYVNELGFEKGEDTPFFDGAAEAMKAIKVAANVLMEVYKDHVFK